ncbi:MAG: hypothetical protein ABIX01_18935 [Chitinophagaceae bacterium]
MPDGHDRSPDSANNFIPYQFLDEAENPEPNNSGWRISYWVKKDSTQKTDLYIRWTNGAANGARLVAGGLRKGNFYLSQFYQETAGFLLLKYYTKVDGMGMPCLLALEKKNAGISINFRDVIVYDPQLAQIVYTDKQQFFLGPALFAYDLNTGKKGR